MQGVAEVLAFMRHLLAPIGHALWGDVQVVH